MVKSQAPNPNPHTAPEGLGLPAGPANSKSQIQNSNRSAPSHTCPALPGGDLTGFTLVELLVVIAIFGLLVAVASIPFASTRGKARDVEREQEMKTIQSALAIYVTNTRIYPITAAGGVCLDGSDSVSTALITAGAISVMPQDPRHDCAGNYHYHYTSPDPGLSYVLTYYLETDTIPGKSTGQQQAAP